MRVLKFGGSSIGTPERILEVKKIIDSVEKPVVIVISAFKGITDQLLRVSQYAVERDGRYRELLKSIEEKHYHMVKAITDIRGQSHILAGIKVLINELEDTLTGIYLLKDLTRKTRDHVAGFGERLSAFIISQLIANSTLVEIRDLIRTDDHFGKARVDFNKTHRLLREFFRDLDECAIVPGFIASNEKGDTTTLGRGGSDYTASIIASALNASVLEIWTDVDGFMTADPLSVEKAYAIESLSYAEAMELSHFGARVVYTPTIQPVFEKKIPIRIKNAFHPDHPGTIIESESKGLDQSPIKGISSIERIDLITLQGSGLVGVTGISARLFSALARDNINIILITQASSEYSISFAVDREDTEKAREAIRNEFAYEIDGKKNVHIHIERELSIIAIVGERMIHTPGISAKLFNALGRNGINVIAIAQGSSELNISVVIRHASLRKALNVIHEGFFLSHYKELHLFLAGAGNVGKSLLKQIGDQRKKLMDKHRLKINLTGITNSKKMLIDPEGLHFKDILRKLNDGDPMDIRRFVSNIADLNLRNSVFIDCTASQAVAAVYGDLFDAYITVVTANKIACSSSLNHYLELQNKAKEKGVRFIYETNVGAGLPIIKTINDLINSGDRILALEAVLSGTLNFIFNTISAEIPFSKAVEMAKEKGYTEPDPRIDLSGIDVVRKLLILSRECGYGIEQKDVKVTPILPPDCFKGSSRDFMKKIRGYDRQFEEYRKKLESMGKRLRYVASLKDGKASVKIREVDQQHPSAALEGSNNIILIWTERYREQPMIIKGYGAGAEVTAAGVFADVIRVANI